MSVGFPARRPDPHQAQYRRAAPGNIPSTLTRTDQHNARGKFSRRSRISLNRATSPDRPAEVATPPFPARPASRRHGPDTGQRGIRDRNSTRLLPSATRLRQRLPVRCQRALTGAASAARRRGRLPLLPLSSHRRSRDPAARCPPPHLNRERWSAALDGVVRRPSSTTRCRRLCDRDNARLADR